LGNQHAQPDQMSDGVLLSSVLNSLSDLDNTLSKIQSEENERLTRLTNKKQTLQAVMEESKDDLMGDVASFQQPIEKINNQMTDIQNKLTAKKDIRNTTLVQIL